MSATDWTRLKQASDADIDRAIAGDTDSFAVKRADRIGRSGASYNYVLYSTGVRQWRWKLVDAQGEAFADSGQVFGSRRAAEAAIRALRDVMTGARAAAA